MRISGVYNCTSVIPSYIPGNINFVITAMVCDNKLHNYSYAAYHEVIIY